MKTQNLTGMRYGFENTSLKLWDQIVIGDFSLDRRPLANRFLQRGGRRLFRVFIQIASQQRTRLLQAIRGFVSALFQSLDVFH